MDRTLRKYRAAALSRQWMEADPEAVGTLHIEVHRGSRPAVDRALEGLFGQLNEMAIIFPGTELTLHYTLTAKPVILEPKQGVILSSQK